MILKTKKEAARKELRFINRTRKMHFGKQSDTHTHIYIPAQPRLQEFLQQFKNRKIFWNSRNSPVVPVNSRNTRKFSQFSAFCPFSLFFHVYFIFHHHSRANVSRTSCTGHICPMNRSFDMFWVILFR